DGAFALRTHDHRPGEKADDNVSCHYAVKVVVGLKGPVVGKQVKIAERVACDNARELRVLSDIGEGEAAVRRLGIGMGKSARKCLVGVERPIRIGFGRCTLAVWKKLANNLAIVATAALIQQIQKVGGKAGQSKLLRTRWTSPHAVLWSNEHSDGRARDPLDQPKAVCSSPAGSILGPV